jgi:hypothetical protein
MANKMSLEGFKPISIHKKERRAIEPKILPCVNCGSTKHIKHYMSYRTDYGEKILEFEMYCDECGDCISAEGYDCRRKVINEWNRRYSNVRGRE